MGHELEELYAESCPHCFRQSMEEFLRSEYLNAAGELRDALKEFTDGHVEQARSRLFNLYGSNLRKGVGQVYKPNTTNLKELEYLFRFEKNVSKFAAHKADYAVRILERAKEGKPDEFDKLGKELLKTFNRYQATEYNTTVSRARTAKQFAIFMERTDVLPNLQWIRTRSASPRDEHLLYAGMILPKSDPFWNENQPGNLWNCKCDWIETAKGSSQAPKKSEYIAPARGLEGNPAKTYELITDKATYISKTRLTPDEVVNFTYPDTKSKLQISVIADNRELTDNILTGRILAQNPELKSISIRPHILSDETKNPEYLINGYVADAKRIHSENGITAGFRSAIEQKCDIVVIDLTKHMDQHPLKTKLIARKIQGRYKDFSNGTIVGCYVAYRNKSVFISPDNFKGDSKTVRLAIERVLKALRG